MIRIPKRLDMELTATRGYTPECYNEFLSTLIWVSKSGSKSPGLIFSTSTTQKFIYL